MKLKLEFLARVLSSPGGLGIFLRNPAEVWRMIVEAVQECEKPELCDQSGFPL